MKNLAYRLRCRLHQCLATQYLGYFRKHGLLNHECSHLQMEEMSVGSHRLTVMGYISG